MVPFTQAIVRECIALGVEEEDRKRIWMEAPRRSPLPDLNPSLSRSGPFLVTFCTPPPPRRTTTKAHVPRPTNNHRERRFAINVSVHVT
eukprot:5480097-Pleurochrysis_carterae.AAC.2